MDRLPKSLPESPGHTDRQESHGPVGQVDTLGFLVDFLVDLVKLFRAQEFNRVVWLHSGVPSPCDSSSVSYGLTIPVA